MKILIVTTDIGKSAPGIVYERIIYGMAQYHEIDLLTANFSPSLKISEVVSNVYFVPQKEFHLRLQKFLMTTMGFNPLDLLWSKKSISLLKKKNYDLIFSFISFNHYAPLFVGKHFSTKKKSKHFVYSVDAIPAPGGWMKRDLFYKKTEHFIKKRLKGIDGFFSANKKMLDYQLTTFDSSNLSVSGVIYNPSGGEFKELEPSKFQGRFLYTGGIYGPRTIKHLFNAFKKILIDYPETTLEFVGAKIEERDLEGFTSEERSKIIIHSFAIDLSPFYQNCTALIDIDADLPADVFLSSKITNYITINRPIISLTGKNSPSREIFKGIPSIIQCPHDEKMIAEAMIRTIIEKENFNFTDRTEVIDLFNIKTVVKTINNYFNESFT